MRLAVTLTAPHSRLDRIVIIARRAPDEAGYPGESPASRPPPALAHRRDKKAGLGAGEKSSKTNDLQLPLSCSDPAGIVLLSAAIREH